MSKVSLVLPVFNEEHIVDDVLPQLREFAKSYQSRVRALEVILVDDGSTDESFSRIMRHVTPDGNIRLIRLFQNSGHQAALLAGIHASGGDAIITLDFDLQDPLESVAEMIDRWETTHADMIVGVRIRREGENFWKRATASIFYRVAGFLGGSALTPDAGDFRLISRRLADDLRGHALPNLFLRGALLRFGYPVQTLEYTRRPRIGGTSKFTWAKMISFAYKGLTFSTARILRLVAMLFSASLLIFFLSQATFGTHVPTESLLRMLISGSGLFSVATGALFVLVLADFVARIYESGFGVQHFRISFDSADANNR